MIKHTAIPAEELRQLIKNRRVLFGGNLRLKIYGRLDCGSGKRIKRENRIFFRSETEAIELGFRPCGRCMKRNRKNEL